MSVQNIVKITESEINTKLMKLESTSRSQSRDKVCFKSQVSGSFQETEKVALLATNEYEGIFRNGGIGTYYRKLSERLNDAGWYVIVLCCFVEESFGGTSTLPTVKHIFSTAETEQVLQLQPLHQATLSAVQDNVVDYHSFRCQLFTQAIVDFFKNSAIYVEFHEMIGIGYHTIQAKRLNLLPSNCVVGVTLHSGHEWIYEANEKYTHDYLDWLWQVCYYEQYCFENADLAFFPSYYLKGRVESYGWNTNCATHLPNYIPIIQPYPFK